MAACFGVEVSSGQEEDRVADCFLIIRPQFPLSIVLAITLFLLTDSLILTFVTKISSFIALFEAGGLSCRAVVITSLYEHLSLTQRYAKDESQMDSSKTTSLSTLSPFTSSGALGTCGASAWTRLLSHKKLQKPRSVRWIPKGAHRWPFQASKTRRRFLLGPVRIAC